MSWQYIRILFYTCIVTIRINSQYTVFRFMVCVCVCVCVCELSHVWLCKPMDCSLPGSSVHGILKTRILEWVTISSSRVSFWPRDQASMSCIAGGFFTTELPDKPGWQGFGPRSASPSYVNWTSNIIPLSFSFFISRVEIMIAHISLH